VLIGAESKVIGVYSGSWGWGWGHVLKWLYLVEVGTVSGVEPVVTIQLQAGLLEWGKLVRGLSWGLGGVLSVDSSLNNPGQDANWVVQGQTHVVGTSR